MEYFQYHSIVNYWIISLLLIIIERSWAIIMKAFKILEDQESTWRLNISLLFPIILWKCLIFTKGMVVRNGHRVTHPYPKRAITYILGAILNQTRKQQGRLTKNGISAQYLGDLTRSFSHTKKKRPVKRQSKGNDAEDICIRIPLKAITMLRT